MPGFMIFLAIFLPISLLLLLRVRVIFLYRSSPRAYISVLFFRFPLYPKKKKKVHPSDYTYRKHKKRLSKQRKKRTQKANASANLPKKKPPFRAQLRFFTGVIRNLYPRFLRHFRMDVTRLHIRVGGPDAATTAITTGLVSQAVAFLLEFLSLHTNVRPSHRADVAVTPDFLSERCTADCKIVFSLRICRIIGLGIRFFYHLLKDKMKNLRTAQNKEDTSCLKTS